MQKSIRRCKPKEAAKLAFALLEASPADALRRAAVMCLEDACLHPLLPSVVWLMMAHSKGYKLSFDHKAMVVKFFCELASSRVRETGDFDTPAEACQQQGTHAPALSEDGKPGELRLTVLACNAFFCSHVELRLCSTASTPSIGPLQTLDQDLRPQQITLPDPPTC